MEGHHALGEGAGGSCEINGPVAPFGSWFAHRNPDRQKDLLLLKGFQHWLGSSGRICSLIAVNK